MIQCSCQGEVKIEIKTNFESEIKNQNRKSKSELGLWYNIWITTLVQDENWNRILKSKLKIEIENWITTLVWKQESDKRGEAIAWLNIQNMKW